MSKPLYYTEQELERQTSLNLIDIQPYDTGSYVEPHTFSAIYHAIPTPPGAGKVAPAGYHSSDLDVEPQASRDPNNNVLLAVAGLVVIVYMLYYRS